MLNFNKSPKHKKFDYIPRFYDQAKEELQQRLVVHQKSELDDIDKSKLNIRRGLHRRANHYKKGYTASSRASNIRLFIIIMILIVICFFILKSEGILQFIEQFSQ